MSAHRADIGDFVPVQVKDNKCARVLGRTGECVRSVDGAGGDVDFGLGELDFAREGGGGGGGGGEGGEGSEGGEECEEHGELCVRIVLVI